MCGQPSKGFFPVEHHVGRVSAVMPSGKAVISVLETSHDTQPASGLYQGVELSEHLGRLVQVFHDFGTGHKIIGLVQHFPFWTEERIVNRHRVASLLKHASQRGPGATAKIQPDRKSTRLNSSHVRISYAVFCLKKKTTH